MEKNTKSTEGKKNSIMSASGKINHPAQHTIKGKPVTHEEFPADMADPMGDAFQDGDLIPLDDVLNEVVTVTSFESREGLYGEFLTIHLDDDRLFNIGSAAVIERMKKVKDSLPMEVVFVRKDLDNGKRMYSVVTKNTFLRMEQAGEIK